eukprot:scaffold109_cov252-Pinguiococcus_pyrenoidosus.AAC.83
MWRVLQERCHSWFCAQKREICGGNTAFPVAKKGIKSVCPILEFQDRSAAEGEVKNCCSRSADLVSFEICKNTCWPIWRPFQRAVKSLVKLWSRSMRPQEENSPLMTELASIGVQSRASEAARSLSNRCLHIPPSPSLRSPTSPGSKCNDVIRREPISACHPPAFFAPFRNRLESSAQHVVSAGRFGALGRSPSGLSDFGAQGGVWCNETGPPEKRLPRHGIPF